MMRKTAMAGGMLVVIMALVLTGCGDRDKPKAVELVDLQMKNVPAKVDPKNRILKGHSTEKAVAQTSGELEGAASMEDAQTSVSAVDMNTTFVAAGLSVAAVEPPTTFDRQDLYIASDKYDNAYPKDLPPLPPCVLPKTDVPTAEQWKSMSVDQAVSQAKGYFEVVRENPSLQSGKHLSKEDADAAGAYFDGYAARLKESRGTMSDDQYREVEIAINDAKRELQIAADVEETEITKVPQRIQAAELWLRRAEIMVRDNNRPIK